MNSYASTFQRRIALFAHMHTLCGDFFLGVLLGICSVLSGINCTLISHISFMDTLGDKCWMHVINFDIQDVILN